MDLFFVVMAMTTSSFCEKLSAFEISEPEVALSHADLSYNEVYHAHKPTGGHEQYIVVMEGILAC